MEIEQLFNEFLTLLGQKLRPAILEAIKEGMLLHKANEADKPPEEGLLTVSEAMAFFRCAKATIYNYQKKGIIKSYRIGSRVYYKKIDLMKSLKERKF
jgi:hypothetical protein